MIGSHGKLSEERVKVIKALLEAREHTHKQIAELATEIWGVSISRSLVTKISLGTRWNEPERSFDMKKPKTGNDFREFTSTKRELSIKDMEVIESILRNMVGNDGR